MKGITKRQQVVLDWMNCYVDEHGYSPTLREIGRGLGIKSLRGVTGHLDALEKKGKITRNGGTYRAIAIVGRDKIGNDVKQWVTECADVLSEIAPQVSVTQYLAIQNLLDRKPFLEGEE